MNTRAVGAGILRPIGLIGVLISAIAIGNCRSNKSPEKPKTKQNDPPVSGVSLTASLIPSIVLETNLSEPLVSEEDPVLHETQNELTVTQVPVMSVTIKELQDFQEAMNVLDCYSARAVLDDKKVIFLKQFGMEDAVHIEERKFGLPPNGKLVAVKTEGKKKPASLAGMLSNVGKAVSHPELTKGERDALKTIKAFLEKVGPFNYDSVASIMKKLVIDDKLTQEEAKKLKEEVHNELIQGLQRLGVKECNE